MSDEIINISTSKKSSKSFISLKASQLENQKSFTALKPSEIRYLKNILLPEEAKINYGQQNDQRPNCPACSSSSVIKYGMNRLGKQRYRCKACGRIFVIPTKSPLSCSKKPVKQWLEYIECMSKCLSIRKTAAIVGIHTSTSFYWRHKILNALRAELSDKVSGIVEIDEAIIPESYKGNHSKDKSFYMGRASRKRGVKLSGRNSVSRVRVICCLDRTDHIFSQLIGKKRPGTKELLDVLNNKIEQGSTICTNNNMAYKFIAKKLELKLYKLTYPNEVIKETYHNQKAKFFGKQLKGFLADFKGVATKYLNNYITWMKWNCLKNANISGLEVMDTFFKVASSGIELRVCDLRGFSSIPRRVCS